MANKKIPNNTRGKRVDSSKKKLEQTTRIRIDQERLNDFDSLDTSFLEGRIEAKAKKDKKYKKKLLTNKKKKSFDFTIIKNIFSILLLIFVVVAVIFYLFNNSSTFSNKPKREKTHQKEETKLVLDDNYLFVGDFHTENLNFTDLDYHYVKVANSMYSSSDLYEHAADDVYRYNPSIVFIEVGINDLNSGVNEADITTRLSEVIDGIKANRKYAKIYIESIYPINNTVQGFDSEILNTEVDNNKIASLNKLIEELCQDKKVNYIDVYTKLIKEDNLNSKYTDNGIYLNEEGYRKVLKLLQQVIDKENAK